MGWVTKLVFWIIPLIVLIILTIAFFGDKSLFTELKLATKDIQEGLPDVGLGLDELKGEKIVFNDQQSKAINSMKEKIILMEGKKDCFLNCGGFPQLGEQGASIEMEWTNDSSGSHSSFTFFGGVGGKQILTGLYFDTKLKPCVIGGTDAISQSFYESYIKSQKTSTFPHYLEIPKLRIFSDGDNKIVYSGFTTYLESSLLYTYDGTQLCFFPTRHEWIGEYEAEGIDNDWFTDDIAWQSKVKYCQ